MFNSRLIGALALSALFLTSLSCSQEEAPEPSMNNQLHAVEETGNGAPSGSHYNLNIIGVEKGKTADMDGSNGHRIFVNLSGNTKIGLAEGDDFQVVDANGTDNDGASFMLPNPDPDNTGTTTYSVFARPLGTPGGSASMTTCAEFYDEELLDWVEVCSEETYVAVRDKGKSTFTNVSKELLYIYVDLDGNGQAERYPLFDDALQNYFWSYDNTGLRLLQLRFYPISTTVPDGENTL